MANKKEEKKAEHKTETKPKLNHQPPKEYNLDTLERPLNNEEQKNFDDLDKDGQKKFIIAKWVEENRGGAGHEVSLEDERFAGLRP